MIGCMDACMDAWMDDGMLVWAHTWLWLYACTHTPLQRAPKGGEVAWGKERLICVSADGIC